MSTHITGTQDLVIVAEGSVAWFKADDTLVAPLTPGAVRYTPSFGQLTLTFALGVSGCGEQGSTTISLSDDGGSLIVKPDGSYDITVTGKDTPPFPAQVTCGGRTATRPDEVLFLEGFTMHGVRADGHLKGGWSKVEGLATYAATWDLTAE